LGHHPKEVYTNEEERSGVETETKGMREVSGGKTAQQVGWRST
jgi:hypothetical protein